jgi:hypothetical protein
LLEGAAAEPGEPVVRAVDLLDDWQHTLMLAA